MKKLVFLFIINWLPAQQSWNLQECLDYALKNNPDVQQSLLEVNKSIHEKNKANGKLLPSVGMGVGHSYSFGSTINPSNNAREATNVQYDQFFAQANLDVFSWKNYLHIGLSKLNKEGSEFRVKTAQNHLQLSIINLFFQYQKSKSWLEVLEPQVAGMKEQIIRTEKEVEIGNRAKSDVYDIKANFGTIQEQWISAQNDNNLAKINLLAALNINQDSVDFVMPDEALSLLSWTSKNEMIEELIKRNPIYLENQKNAEIAVQKIKMAKSNYLPTISGQYQWSTFYSKTLNANLISESFSNQFSQNKNQQVYLGFNIPVFQQFQVKNNVEIAKLDQLNIHLENQKRLTELYKVLNIIAEQYLNASERNRLLQENFENQKLSFDRSEEKYREGLIDAYNFFVVRNNWLQANYNLINSKYDVMQQAALLRVFEN
ncbi:TolC family protein [Chryseobacterium sp. POL2]|uniref:TolC family protein n=1 Tax=Chryseobacterium sp. POL2 TaxID=2713414 RepID=UPI0013E15358|nr:TolC family protein [Chryseobacterium sp. POL2]QIG88895.1 TolC family protein [Chryseobacterium sp. POL2]